MSSENLVCVRKFSLTNLNSNGEMKANFNPAVTYPVFLVINGEYSNSYLVVDDKGYKVWLVETDFETLCEG